MSIITGRRPPITVRGHGVPLSEALEEHCRRRLAFALGRHADRISHVHVRLSDVNGPRGGTDIRCRVLAELDGLGAVVVHALTDDAYASVDLAASKVAAAIARRIGRAQRARHAPGRRNAGLARPVVALRAGRR
jgi:putative sigma-54 modulation protein